MKSERESPQEKKLREWDRRERGVWLKGRTKESFENGMRLGIKGERKKIFQVLFVPSSFSS